MHKGTCISDKNNVLADAAEARFYPGMHIDGLRAAQRQQVVESGRWLPVAAVAKRVCSTAGDDQANANELCRDDLSSLVF